MRDLKKKRYEAEGAKEYRKANRRIQKAVKKAKEDWIGAQCEEIETCLNKNNSKRAYQLVKDLTSEKQGRSSTIMDKSGKCLTEEKEILSRWTEYCSELYSCESCGDSAVLDCSQPPEEDLLPILREEVVIAIASLKKGKSAGVDNIPAELVQAGGVTMIDVLTEICNRIWRTGEWPTPWTQSLIITLPNKSAADIAWCPATALTSSEVTVLNLCTSSGHALYLYQVSRNYLERYQSYRVDMISILKITKGTTCNSAKR